jgi:hypothetical protein
MLLQWAKISPTASSQLDMCPGAENTKRCNKCIFTQTFAGLKITTFWHIALRSLVSDRCRVYYNETTQNNMPEGFTVQTRHRENLKCHISCFIVNLKEITKFRFSLKLFKLFTCVFMWCSIRVLVQDIDQAIVVVVHVDGVILCLWTAATRGTIVHPQVIYECRAELYWQRKTE